MPFVALNCMMLSNKFSFVAKKCFFKKDEVTFQTYEKLLYCNSQNCKVKAKMFKLG